MRNEKTLLGSTGFNIQLFAGTPNVNLTEGEQAKYVNNVIRAVGKPDAKPSVERYFAKSVSTNAAYSLFYVGGRLTARDRVSTENQTNKNFDDVKGVTAGKLIKSVMVIPTGMEVPLWIENTEFDKSQLNEESAIQEMQVDAIYNGKDKRISQLLYKIATEGKRTVKNSAGVETDLTIPEANKFGDETKLFSDPYNLKEFRRAAKKLKKLSKNGKRLRCMIIGEDASVELDDEEKFTNKDWVTINGSTPNQTGETIDVLLGANVEELFTFDEVFYPTGLETTGYIIMMVEQCIGLDDKKASVNPIIEHVSWKKAWYLDVEISNATELLDPEGILIFKYKRDIPAE